MKTKAVIFDFDGTLSKPRVGSSSWYEVWKYLDDLEYDDFLYSSYKRGDFSFEGWLERIVERFKQKGLKKSDLEFVSKEIVLLDGVKETFLALKQQNIKIIILSSGVKPMMMSALQKGGVEKYLDEFVGYDFLFDEKGNLNEFYSPFGNIEPKSKEIEHFKKTYNLLGEEILYVGNDENDEEVYLAGVRTLCINPYRADISNKLAWHNAIEKCENLTEILKFVEN